MKKSIFILSIIFILLLFLTSCEKKGIEVEYHYYQDYETISQYLTIPATPLEYSYQFPKYYGSRVRSFDRDKATLGRVMFYDKNLSKDRTVSCGTCHLQELGFTDGKVVSDGIEGRKTSRNSLALGSVFSFNEYYGAGSRIPFFWDNRATSVAEQSTQAFNNPNEMGMNIPLIVQRIKEQPYYAPLFEAAYPSERVAELNILDAMSVFVNSIASFSSKYDHELDKLYAQSINFSDLEGTNMSGLTAEQNIGKDLFLVNCSSCHGQINGRPGKRKANNGLSMNYEDEGVGGITNSSYDVGAFKVPTLRNIEFTAPYMHDGSIATLEEVVEHYSSGIKNHDNLDELLKENGEPKKMNFTTSEKTALVSFLKTFTDQKSLTNEMYSNPFK